MSFLEVNKWIYKKWKLFNSVVFFCPAYRIHISDPCYQKLVVYGYYQIERRGTIPIKVSFTGLVLIMKKVEKFGNK